MPVAIDCPQCGRVLHLPYTLMDRAVKCPACRVVFTAPGFPQRPEALPLVALDKPGEPVRPMP